MKLLLFKYSIPLVYGLSAMVFVLVITMSLLYFEKTKTQTYNRTLILQNDSILSEHIRLKNALSREVNNTNDKNIRFSQPGPSANR